MIQVYTLSIVLSLYLTYSLIRKDYGRALSALTVVFLLICSFIPIINMLTATVGLLAFTVKVSEIRERFK